MSMTRNKAGWYLFIASVLLLALTGFMNWYGHAQLVALHPEVRKIDLLDAQIKDIRSKFNEKESVRNRLLQTRPLDSLQVSKPMDAAGVNAMLSSSLQGFNPEQITIHTEPTQASDRHLEFRTSISIRDLSPAELFKVLASLEQHKKETCYITRISELNISTNNNLTLDATIRVLLLQVIKKS